MRSNRYRLSEGVSGRLGDFVGTSHHIRLHDVVIDTVDALRADIADILPETSNPHIGSNDPAVTIAQQLEQASWRCVNMLAHGAYFGDDATRRLWQEALQRLSSDLPRASQGSTSIADLRMFPARLAFYASAIAAFLRGDFELLQALAYTPLPTRQALFMPGASGREIAAIRLAPNATLDSALADKMPRNRAPGNASSTEILRYLKPAFLRLAPTSGHYEVAFDRFEVLLTLHVCDAILQKVPGAPLRPSPGRFWVHSVARQSG